MISRGRGNPEITNSASLVRYLINSRTFVLGAKNELIETVILSTHNLCFG